MPCWSKKKENEEDKEKPSVDLIYSISDNPPWYMCIIFGFQHLLLSLGGSIGPIVILAKSLCIADTEEGIAVKAKLVGSVLAVNGIASFLQATFGTRLPIYQGSSFSFLVPAIALFKLQKCPSPLSVEKLNDLGFPDNITLYDVKNDFGGNYSTFDQVWQERVRELQGGLAIASVFEIVIGATGLVGLMTRLFGPVTICVTITLIGVHLAEVSPSHAGVQWGCALFTAFVLVLASQYLKNCKIPFPAFSIRKKKFYKIKTEPFKMYPVLLAIGLGWLLCWILVHTEVFKEGSPLFIDTEVKSKTLKNSDWLYAPYPFQWGVPKVSVGAAVGMLAGIIASIIESIGDYNACATLSGAPSIPKHATNRGIMMEGFGCLLASLVGTTTGTTSYSENVAAIGVTRVASRRVIQVAGIIGLVIGFIGKIATFLVSIPEPVYGGVFMAVFGMIISVGLTNLQYVDLNSSRNIFVIGISFHLGIMIPYAINNGKLVINTGVEELDVIINVILGSSLTVGAIVATFFDNTLPGTAKERGLTAFYNQQLECKEEGQEISKQLKTCYDPPMLKCCMCKLCSFLPFMPKTETKPIDEENADYVIETADIGGEKNKAFEENTF